MELKKLDPMIRGDGRAFIATLALEGASWAVPTGAAVRCTGKRVATLPDSKAQFIKTLDSGITVSGNEVTVALAPADTDSMSKDANLYCDIQVTPAGGEPVTVSRFLLPVYLDASRTTP